MFLITVMSQNSEPYSRGIPFWYSIAVPKFQLNTAKTLQFWIAASCVRLKDKTGSSSSLTGFMINFLIVVTSHVPLDFCVQSSITFNISDIFLLLSRALRWLYVMFLFYASIGVVSTGLLSVSIR